MEKRIYYHDTDAGGVVYYANYLAYMEEARIDFFHDHALSETTLADQPVFFPVHTCTIRYHRPAFYGDMITCNAMIKKISPAKIIFLQQVINQKSQQLLVEAEITLACVHAKNFRPMRIPDDVSKKLMSQSK